MALPGNMLYNVRQKLQLVSKNLKTFETCA